MDLATLPQIVTPSGTVSLSAVVSSSDFPQLSDKLRLNLTKKIMGSRDVPTPNNIFFLPGSVNGGCQSELDHSK
jgi:hypothetical protein